MANISAYAEKTMLDWVLGGAAASAPGARFAALAIGAPTSIAASEAATNSGLTRMTITFGAAASPGGSATNAAAVTFGPASTAYSITGLDLFDDASGGHMWWYGNLTTARTLSSGDSLVIASAALTVTLA